MPGAQVFATRCAVCHGAKAEGIPGAFPVLHEQIVAFAASAAGREYLVMVVTTGLMGEVRIKGVSYSGVMPPQYNLSDAEVAGVLSYLGAAMSAGDAEKPALTAEDVADIRLRRSERSAQATRALRPAFPEQ